MAKSKGKSLVIVESPAKARTISKYLGADYIVEASIGHVRDLPAGKKEVPEKYKAETWAYLGVNTEADFEPLYIVPDEKKKQVKKLKDALKQADELFLATDEDREGEAISWHLQGTVSSQKSLSIDWSFTRSRKTAIQNALKGDSPDRQIVWFEPRKHGGFSTDCTVSTCPICFGERSGKAPVLDASRVLPCD